MIIRFVSQAHAELTDAVAYYEGELSGLGYRFWKEVDSTSHGSRQITTHHDCGLATIAAST